jgi:hypothetical protein
VHSLLGMEYDVSSTYTDGTEAMLRCPSRVSEGSLQAQPGGLFGVHCLLARRATRIRLFQNQNQAEFSQNL